MALISQNAFRKLGINHNEMTREHIDIVRYRPEHADAVAGLHAHVSSADPALTAAYLTWKYRRNPYLSEPHIYLAMKNGAPVGMRGFYGARWQIGSDASRIIPCASDLLIAPAHRNRGLFARISRKAEEVLSSEGYPCLFSLSASPVTRVGSLALGWKVAAALGELRREAPIAVLKRRSKRRIKSTLQDLFGAHTASRIAARAKVPPRRASAFAQLDRIDRDRVTGCVALRTLRADAMARLIARLPRDARLRHLRDDSYFAWRYDDPLSDHRFIYCGGDVLEGYMVLRIPRNGGGREIKIVDWEGSERAVTHALLDHALRGRFPVVTAAALGLDQDKKDGLQRHGFLPRAEGKSGIAAQGHHILVRSLTRDGNAWPQTRLSVLDCATWDFRLVYSDLY